MKIQNIHTVCVCGAGTMGRGIAQVAAQSGFQCILFDVQEDALNNASRSILDSLQILVSKGKIHAEEFESIAARLSFTANINECKADLVIEAVLEKPEAKIALFNDLAAVNASKAIFATNTSSLSVTDIARSIENSSRVIGMHFFNPATIMKLVEVVKTNFTEHSVVQEVIDVARQMNKIPVICNDSPGFIVNHVARPFYLESLKMVENGISDVSTIDALLEASGFRMGPFRLMDLIGNDINFAVSTSVYEQLGRPSRLQPSPLQEEKVKAGALGKKSGKGYYDYPG